MFNAKQIIFILGIFLSILTGFMFVPMAFALFYGEETIGDFMISGLCSGFIAILCIQNGRNHHFNLNIRDMFMLTSITWFVVSLFAALPFTLYHGINYTDAFFETMSGITTTGSTVMSGLDSMDRSILVWRSLLQWLGGIGFIVMAVAILPFLNVGGMRLFRTESSDWSDKTIPRTQHMAKHLFLIYVVLTLLCTVSYHMAGMSWFDAINHAMTTLSTGGYSTSDSSMAAFSHSAHWVGIVFMLAGGLPLLMFVQTIQQRSVRLWNDQQVIGFLRFVLLVSFSLAFWLWREQDIAFIDALRLASFNVTSVITTTGYGLTDYQSWGAVASVVFLFLMFIGSCSGSTSGGIKIFRFQIAFSIMRQQIKQQFHPNGVFKDKYNGHRINDDIVRSIMAFFMLMVIVILMLSITLVLTGLDPMTSFTGAITAVTNVGPGLGPIIGPAGNFAPLPDVAKWALAIGMLLGRLEILTVAVLFHPKFWRF
ncbi:TrkH family potassium uptake protein [Shewanella sp. SR43-4]|jgi:trk system potassium uptake protein TrkH|uniref:Trk system potassium uptake protein n=1 Tax=Shewanella vesiculosa TaxID=518738 RepID=A0ABV0FW42_9GAMM|nr:MULTISPECIES: TrkH family potassium uptake protein [unclassified Shewanella]MBB1319462.1 TrkH family potassium uptake protein [Shewanella sp. SR43-4]MBB1323493.1 TrkH family potassium uptake protein [Shewanella sp. SR43-8]MBB1391314.1 TrkH family potassium uptake protein [Shewanella sp. SG44-6]MBB1477697.1 TrkH family potassium uptake protein [Shewanella sp. SG41-3]|tara:strand:+ start:1620 stop:3062 length:1443 start_codon:yes stop_codon:yes gene_type:complete